MFPGTGVGSGPCPAQPRAMQRGNLAYGVGITSPSLSRLVTPGEFLTSEQRDTHSLTAQDLNPFSPGARSRAWPLRDAIPGVSCATSPLNVLFTWLAPEGLSGDACPRRPGQVAAWLLLTLPELSSHSLSPKPATLPPLASYYCPQCALW